VVGRLVGWFGRLPGGHNCLRKLYARTESGQEKKNVLEKQKDTGEGPSATAENRHSPKLQT